MFKTSLGVEIAGKDLRIAVLRSAFGRMRLLQTLEIAGFADLTREEQQAALQKVVQERKLPMHRVFLSLSQEQGVLRQLEFPIEVRENLKSAIELQIETLAPWAPDEIYWDFTRELPQKGAKTFRVIVTMIPRATLDPWIDFFKSVKLPLSGASLSSLTCAHGVRALWSVNATTVVLDCEPGYVEGCLVQAGQMCSASNSGPDVVENARIATERLMALGRLDNPESARVIAYGSQSSLIDAAAADAPFENGNPESMQRFGAIASALNGLKKTAFESNLVPKYARYHQSRVQLIPTYVLLLVAGLLGVAMLLREPYQMMAYASQLQDEIRRVSTAAREVSRQQSELNKLSERYRALSQHFQNRDYNLEAIRQLARILPATAWISSYAYQDNAITITGLADSASEIQKSLEDDPLFKDVQFTGAVNKDPKGKDRFTLKANIEVPK
jgi:Tfp pilus assembly protein PilN